MQIGSNKGAKTKTLSRGMQFGVRLTAKLAPLGTGKWFAYMPSCARENGSPKQLEMALESIR